MSRVFYRLLALGSLFAMVASAANAQTLPPDHEHAGHTALCGTQWISDGGEAAALANTARTNPELYRQMIARSKNGVRGVRALSSGRFPYFVRDRVPPYAYRTVEADMVYESAKSRIFVDVDANVSANTIRQLSRGLDSITGAQSRNSQKGILDNDIEVFGEPPTLFGDDKVINFLLTDIQDGFTGGAFVAGYFSPFDQTTEPGSNQLNVLYIDSKEGLGQGITNVLNTLAHEFQHLIHYNTYRESDVVYNEGCSEVASLLCGYATRGNNGYLSNTNVDLFRWSRSDETGSLLLSDYERAMTFMYYLYDEFGESFLTKFNSTQVQGIDRVRAAMAANGNGENWQDALKSWGVANWVLTGYDDARYTYAKPFTSRKPTAQERFQGTTFPATGSAQIQPYGVYYIDMNTPGTGVKAKFTTGREFRVAAILYNGTAIESVIDVPIGEERTYGGSTPYSRIIFVIVNTELQANSATINWEMQGVTLGVDNDEANAHAAGLELMAPRPNPAMGLTTLPFDIAKSGLVTLDVYSMQGERLLRAVDNVRYSAGSHNVTLDASVLPNGIYKLRLVQGDRSVTRTMVVLR